MSLKIKILLFTIVGAGFGYAYYHYFGCTSGCAIQSNWKISTLYGAIIGLALAIPSKSKIRK
jgi:hypothetical protein